MGVRQDPGFRHREHGLRLLARHNHWTASEGRMAASLDTPDEGRRAGFATRGHSHNGICSRSRTRSSGSGPRLSIPGVTHGLWPATRIANSLRYSLTALSAMTCVFVEVN